MDEKEFATLIKERYRSVYKLAFYMLNNEEESKDATQEVFAKAWKAKADLNFSTSSAWLKTTTANICIDLLRRRKFQAEPISDELYMDKKADPESAYIIKENMEMVGEALKRLPIRLKSALLLREMEGLNYEEISQTLKIPIGTVKSDIHRAKRLMRQILRPNYNK